MKIPGKYVHVHNFQNADYTTGQMFDLADKLEQSEGQLGRGTYMIGMDAQEKKTEDKLAKATKDAYVHINICGI